MVLKEYIGRNYLGRLMVIQISRLYSQRLRGYEVIYPELFWTNSLTLLTAVKGLIFYLLQANQLACHSFMYIGKRWKMPGSETTDFVPHDTGSRIINLWQFPLPPKSHRLMLGFRWMSAHALGWGIGENAKIRRALSKPNSGYSWKSLRSPATYFDHNL